MANQERPTLNPALRDFWLQPARNRVLYGGRGSSKSWDAAGFAIYLSCNYRLRVLCTRQFQNKIEESVYSLLKGQIERFGLRNQFRVLENRIIHRGTGTEFLFYGLWRHIDEIKSLEGIDVCWIEEAHNLTEKQWEVLEPTIRKEHSQFWLTFNPKLCTDFVYKRFVVNPPPRTVVRKINYIENPFLSQTMLDVIEAAREEDEDDYAHVYLGEPRTDDDDAIIKRSWVQAAIDAHLVLGIEPVGSKRLGFDVADSGSDKCAMIEAKGSLAYWGEEWKAREDELLISCTKVWARARESGAAVTYDSIGVGASAGAKFGELNAARQCGATVAYAKFNAGGAVYKPDAQYKPGTQNKDMFANIKAQAWWLVADRFRNTFNAIRNGAKFRPDELLFLDSSMPNLEKLIDELCTPKRDFDAAGRVKVESKKDLAKPTREGGAVPSPNLADAFIMAFAPGQTAMSINPELLRRA